jgi:hypothetical protein
MRPLAIALVHFPVLARDGSVVTTAITNLDIHDIARSSFTYGIERYYIVHPVAAQRVLARRVQTHWTTGAGADRIPDRRPPMQCLRIVENLEQARRDWSEVCEVWVTSAISGADATEHGRARALLEGDGAPVLLVLGTGWGLAPEIMQGATRRLAPIVSPREDGYNHLSVRAAAAIFLDRLLGGNEP